MAESLCKRLQQSAPVIIDGGLATELEAQGHDLSNPLWSASLIRSNPDAIVAAHRAYLDAGAEVIISASYQTNDPELTAASIELACRARDEYLADNADVARPLVAASAGPYGASLGDGSEYTGNYGVDADVIREYHAKRLAAIIESDADLIACETIPSATEARVLAQLLSNVNLESWVSFSCKDGRHLCGGAAICEVATLFDDVDSVTALGINCTQPQFVGSLVSELKRSGTAKAVVVYPNSGEDFDAVTKTWSGTVTPLDWRDAAHQWATAGATIIGGCCRTGPAHIHGLAGKHK